MKGEKVEDKYGGKKQRLAIEHVANVDDERVPAGIKKDSHCMGNVAVNKTKMMLVKVKQESSKYLPEEPQYN